MGVPARLCTASMRPPCGGCPEAATSSMSGDARSPPMESLESVRRSGTGPYDGARGARAFGGFCSPSGERLAALVLTLVPVSSGAAFSACLTAVG